jgi:DNA-binding response OmpR family regulator
MGNPRKVCIVDDEQYILSLLKRALEKKYKNLVVETFEDPLSAIKSFNKDLHLLILDLEMPQIDGKKLLQFAVEKGVRKERIIIFSSRDAKDLHQLFPQGECLCVISKRDGEQLKALTYILDSIMRKER